MRAYRKRAIKALTASVVCVFLPRFANATTYDWQSPADGLWNTFTNWNPQSVPGTNDDVNFNLNGSYTATISDAESANNLSMNGGGFATLSVQSSSSTGYANLSINNGSIASGNLEVEAGQGYSASLNVAGTLSIGSGGLLDLGTFGDTSAGVVENGNIVNAGQVGSGTVLTQLQGTMTNSGEWIVSGPGILPSVCSLNGTFNQNGGQFEFSPMAFLNVTGGTFNFSGGTITGTTAASDSANGGVIALTESSTLQTSVADGGGAVFNAFQTIQMIGNLAPNTSLIVTSSNTESYAYLDVPAGFVNNGNITLQCNDGYQTSINSGDGTGDINNAGTMGMTTNLPLGEAAPAYVNGNLVNTGTVYTTNNVVLNGNASNSGEFDLGSGTTLSMSGFRFNQDGGYLGDDGVTPFNISGGGFNFNGGYLYAPVNLYEGSYLSDVVTDEPGVVFNGYQTVTLNGGFPVGANLNVISNSTQSYATLYVQAGVVNNGNINLEADDGYTTTLVSGDGTGDVNNAGTMSITTDLTPGVNAGAISINGNLVNSGSIYMNDDLNLNGNASNSGQFNIGNGATLRMTGYRFNQDGGYLGNSGDTHFVINSGGFNFNGGNVNLTVDLYNNSYLSTPVLNADPSGSGVVVFNVYQTGTLHGDLANQAAINAIANSSQSYGYLYVDDGAANRGSMNLEGNDGYGEDLIVGSGTGTLNNYGSMSFTTNGNGYTRTDGNINNFGSIYITGYTTFLGSLANNGSLTVGPGTSVNFANQLGLGNGSTLTVEGGGAVLNLSGGQTISGAQVISNDGGSLVFSGGGNVIGVNGCSLIAQDGSGITTTDGSSLIAQDGSGLIAQDGSGLTAEASTGGSSSVAGIGQFGSANTLLFSDGVNSPVSSSSMTSSIIANAGGTIMLSASSLKATNYVDIEQGGIFTGNGTVTSGAAQNLGIITATGGTLSFSSALNNFSGQVEADATGRLAISGLLTMNGGTLGGAGVITAAGGLHVTAATKKIGTGEVIVSGGVLAIDAGISLDMSSGSLIVDYAGSSPIAMIRGDLAGGFNGGAWNGIGINSSAVAALNSSQSALIYSVGYADGADGIVNGLSSGQIEIMPTLAGDAKLQGNVVFGDFQLLSQYFGQSGTSWDEGNFSYGSTTNFGDFQLLSQDFGAHASGLTTGEIASLNGFAAQFGDTLVANAGGAGFQVVSVPEPVAGGLIVLGLGLAARRKRRAKL